MENRDLSIKDYLPTKNQLRLECDTVLVYLNMKNLESVLYVLSYILNFCEDDNDLLEINRFFKYCSTRDEFSKDFYDKYACLFSKRGKEIVDDLFERYDFDGIFEQFERESLKNSNLKKKKLLVKDVNNDYNN